MDWRRGLSQAKATFGDQNSLYFIRLFHEKGGFVFEGLRGRRCNYLNSRPRPKCIETSLVARQKLDFLRLYVIDF